jgi:hypothetical protein
LGEGLAFYLSGKLSTLSDFLVVPATFRYRMPATAGDPWVSL